MIWLKGRSGGADQKPLHLVSAWASERHLVLGQVATDEKSNEMTAIPALLKRLEVGGCLVTMDAMGTQKTLARQIVKAGGDYLLAVKAHHKTLLEDIHTFFQQPPTGYVIDETRSVEKGHGRLEQRCCRICTEVEWLHLRHPQWEGLAAIIEVTLTVEKGGKPISLYTTQISPVSFWDK